MVSAPPTPTDKKRSKKKQKDQPTDIRADSSQKEKKRKNKQHEDTNTPEPEAKATELAQVTNEDAERPIKRQKKDDLETPTPGEQQAVESKGAASKKPKREKRPKRPKDKSKKVRKEEGPNPKDKIQIADVPIPYTNPLTDESLSDFAQRGLAYAYQYAQHVSLTSESERAAKQPWKFNKARQNWILRNVVDPTGIPDSYLPISLLYIESIQGGARNDLKKTCKIIKKQAKASKASSLEDPNGSKSEADKSPEAKDESSKKVTFATGTMEPMAAESETSAPSKVKVKRAKIIIKVLKGKIRPQDV
ncbi:unnamed protein product [Rhizoctonia solani]|uniref:WKF domain-containing protein n=1 Tax=Rhizoctonia solani TaxID=456999 RepID=A0A8H2XFJ8_9AGAM|nr:unnamed protein product [Rhizoctonia solani]